jgi:hypothetical protein
MHDPRIQSYLLTLACVIAATLCKEPGLMVSNFAKKLSLSCLINSIDRLFVLVVCHFCMYARVCMYAYVRMYVHRSVFLFYASSFLFFF